MAEAAHRWRFFRAGGFDQVRIDSLDDLKSLGQLDQKLWVALSCPTNGIEFDARTLALMDSDSDTHIRAPELLAAIDWSVSRLVNPEILVQKQQGVSLNSIGDDDEEGLAIHIAAKNLALELGRGDDEILTVEETSAAQDGVVARAMTAWEEAGAAARCLGDETAHAHEALLAIKDKVEDFFVRCQLAAFDNRAGDALNASEDAFKALAPAGLTADTESIAALPLAKVAANSSLPLGSGVNPAWAGRIAAFGDAVVLPLLGHTESISQAEWENLKGQFDQYSSWLGSKPDVSLIGDGVLGLEKLSRYVRDIHTLANNFVAFKDFYTRQGKATFQIGTLYLDGRSCELCVAVEDVAKHSTLAALSRMCLVYCQCTRGAEKRFIAAAFTAGDSDQLMLARNGVFYDRQGRDWDATIVKIVDQPISLRQAFWSPYRQFARMVSDQFQKVAASKAKESDAKMTTMATQVTQKGTTVPSPAAHPPEPAKAAPPAAFDVGKFAGIFAAIGLALGALGTALASVVAGLFSLKLWQLPLVVVGVMLLISGPAVILAWFKLRSRNLGPILDANAWAVNARARINIPFGTSLTQIAQLPANAERSLSDPYAEKPSRWPYFVLFLAAVAGAAAYMYLH